MKDTGTMTEKLSPKERAKKAQAAVLQRLAEATQVAVAVAMGTSESTVARIKAERLEEVLLMISHLGLKLVPSDYKCVDREAYDFLVRSHTRVMARAPELIWEQDDQ